MNWKLVLQLSLFGLAMGIGTVFVIPPNVEPVLWLVIFLVCAYIIARRCPDKRFQHGVFVGLANCVWISACHILLFDQYLALHPAEAALMKAMPLGDSGRLLMALTGPIVGSISGIVIGIIAAIFGKVLKRASHPQTPA
jgi:hypothetical protein